MGHAGTGGRRYRGVPGGAAHLVPNGADPIPAGERPPRSAAPGAPGTGGRARRGVAAPSPQRRAAAGRRRPAGDAAPPGRAARSPRGRARRTGLTAGSAGLPADVHERLAGGVARPLLMRHAADLFTHLANRVAEDAEIPPAYRIVGVGIEDERTRGQVATIPG